MSGNKEIQFNKSNGSWVFLSTALLSSLETAINLVLSITIICLSFTLKSTPLSVVFFLETSSFRRAFLNAVTYLLCASVLAGSASITFLNASHYVFTRSSYGSVPLWFSDMKILKALISDSTFSREDSWIPAQFISLIIIWITIVHRKSNILTLIIPISSFPFVQ